MPSPSSAEVAETSWSAARNSNFASATRPLAAPGRDRLDHFVDFGQHQSIRDRRLVEQRHHLFVAVHHPAPGIDQERHPPQPRPSAQVCEDQLLPVCRLGLGALGEAIAGQIDQHQPFRQLEEVDLPCRAGGLGHPRQSLAPGQRIDQAGLAGVGTADKGHFGNPSGSRLSGLCAPRRNRKVRRTGCAPPRFSSAVIGCANGPRFQILEQMHLHTDSARMVTYCCATVGTLFRRNRSPARPGRS